MPIVRKLTAEEVAALEVKRNKGGEARSAIAAQYDQFLIEFQPNELGEVTLDEGERKLNIRNRLRAAAERQGLKLEFIRTNGLAAAHTVQRGTSPRANARAMALWRAISGGSS